MRFLVNISLIYNTPILIVGRGLDYFVLYLLKNRIRYVLAVRMTRHVSYKEMDEFPSRNEINDAPYTVGDQGVVPRLKLLFEANPKLTLTS